MVPGVVRLWPVTRPPLHYVERGRLPPVIPADQLDELGRKILGAFEGPRNDWRTAWGIAEETGVSEGDVLVYIDRHPDCFIRDVVMGGVIYGNTARLSPSMCSS